MVGRNPQTCYKEIISKKLFIQQNAKDSGKLIGPSDHQQALQVDSIFTARDVTSGHF